MAAAVAITLPSRKPRVARFSQSRFTMQCSYLLMLVGLARTDLHARHATMAVSLRRASTGGEHRVILVNTDLATGFALFIASETLLNDETAAQAFIEITEAQW